MSDEGEKSLPTLSPEQIRQAKELMERSFSAETWIGAPETLLRLLEHAAPLEGESEEKEDGQA